MTLQRKTKEMYKALGTWTTVRAFLIEHGCKVTMDTLMKWNSGFSLEVQELDKRAGFDSAYEYIQKQTKRPT